MGAFLWPNSNPNPNRNPLTVTLFKMHWFTFRSESMNIVLWDTIHRWITFVRVSTIWRDIALQHKATAKHTLTHTHTHTQGHTHSVNALHIYLTFFCFDVCNNGVYSWRSINTAGFIYLQDINSFDLFHLNRKGSFNLLHRAYVPAQKITACW